MPLASSFRVPLNKIFYSVKSSSVSTPVVLFWTLKPTAMSSWNILLCVTSHLVLTDIFNRSILLSFIINYPWRKLLCAFKINEGEVNFCKQLIISKLWNGILKNWKFESNSQRNNFLVNRSIEKLFVAVDSKTTNHSVENHSPITTEIILNGTRGVHRVGAGFRYPHHSVKFNISRLSP